VKAVRRRDQTRERTLEHTCTRVHTRAHARTRATAHTPGDGEDGGGRDLLLTALDGGQQVHRAVVDPLLDLPPPRAGARAHGGAGRAESQSAAATERSRADTTGIGRILRSRGDAHRERHLSRRVTTPYTDTNPRR
jgi:hypothetical protein